MGRFFGQGMRPFLAGMALSAVFYAVLRLPILENSILHAYTAHHVTEYIIVILFFWANAEILFNWLRVRKEERIIGYNWLPPRDGIAGPEFASAQLERLDSKFRDLRSTFTFQRIHAALTFVSERGSASGFREYLESLAQRDADTVHERYGFSRFVTAILPIMGLIGTVIHFGFAFSGLALDGLEAKIPTVVNEMGTAFNTTCTAMICMATTVLSRFLIERKDVEALKKIDVLVEGNLLYRFTLADERVAPFLGLIEQANESLVRSLAEFEQRLANDWIHRTELQQQRWEEVLTLQAEHFQQFLKLLSDRQSAQVQQFGMFSQDLSQATEVMEQVATAINGNGQLLELQENLTNNLIVLRENQQLENAMHELTAAIHLFTARQNASSKTNRAA